MAKYRITAPDGGTYEITAPDDATQEQVLAYAQSNYQGAARSSAQAERPDFSDVSAGVDSSAPMRVPLYHADGRLTDAGWQAERDKLRYQDEAESGKNSWGKVGAGYIKGFKDFGLGVRQFAVDLASAPPPIEIGANLLGMTGLADRMKRGRAPITEYAQSLREAEAVRRREESGFSKSGAGMAGNIGATALQVIGPGVLARGD